MEIKQALELEKRLWIELEERDKCVTLDAPDDIPIIIALVLVDLLREFKYFNENLGRIREGAQIIIDHEAWIRAGCRGIPK